MRELGSAEMAALAGGATAPNKAALDSSQSYYVDEGVYDVIYVPSPYSSSGDAGVDVSFELRADLHGKEG